MKFIELTRGYYATVDDEDHEWLNRWMWFAYPAGRTWYAAKVADRDDGRVGGPMIGMHALLLFSGDQVDHINNNGLDNQKHNLRFADQSRNSRNMQKCLGNTSSKFKGVCWQKYMGKWSARIAIDRGVGGKIRRPWLGHFNSEHEAAVAYDKAAKHYFGDFARLNFP